MSEIFVFHKLHKQSEKREQILGRILWMIIIILAALAVIRVISQFLVSPGFKITNIIVESDLLLSKEEILRIAGLEKNKYYFKPDFKEIEQSLNSIVQVRDVTVERIFPETLKIVLYSRMVVALALAGGTEQSIPVAFDQEGIIILAGREITHWNFPVISGLQFNSYQPGTKLPAQLVTLLNEISSLKENFTNLYDLISEIKVESTGSGDFELVLFFIPYSTAVRVGRRLQGEQLGYALMLLDVLTQQAIADRVKEIDFRTNEVVYRAEEGVIN